MLTQALAFVIETIFNIFILTALVRFWMQVLRAPARNPLAQFTMALTDFAVKPMRRLLPGFFKLDVASLAVAWIAEVILLAIVSLLQGVEIVNGTALSVLLFLALVKLLRLTVYIIMGAVFLQAILSWVNPYHPVAPFFEAMTRPFLKPFQRAIPPIGGVDITPVLVLIACQLVLMLPVAWLEGEALRMIARFAL
ncbi:MAG: YggT family protein [Burkholderiales bacterium]|nr:YggT family protein [Burkholderiales bacterium]MBZ0251453.1 YggT family protein [Burkholderiales bacterium]HQY48446.1 YggT family protein [Usitatibacteraceae bacterium]